MLQSAAALTAISGVFVGLARNSNQLILFSLVVLIACGFITALGQLRGAETLLGTSASDNAAPSVLAWLDAVDNTQVKQTMQDYLIEHRITLGRALRRWGITEKQYYYYTHRTEV